MIAKIAQRQTVGLDREHGTVLAELLELEAAPTAVTFPVALTAGHPLCKIVEVAHRMVGYELIHDVIELGIAGAMGIVRGLKQTGLASIRAHIASALITSTTMLATGFEHAAGKHHHVKMPQRIDARALIRHAQMLILILVDV